MTATAPLEDVLVEDLVPFQEEERAPIFSLGFNFNIEKDMAKEGWELVFDPEVYYYKFIVELVPFVGEQNDLVGNSEMLRRARKLEIDTSQRHAEAIVRMEEIIPVEWRGFTLVFNTIWEHSIGNHCVPISHFDGVGWKLRFNNRQPFFSKKCRLVRVHAA